MKRRAAGGATASARRGFLGRVLGLATATAAGGAWLSIAPPAAAATRARGRARIDVREHGARGDAVSDDTAAFQAAIDALPEDGGTVHVPSGAYLIDPTRSVRLRSRMHLAMADGARLMAKANAAPRAYVLFAEQVQDVEISGGRIVGDRDTHLGETGEWGHGIRIRGCGGVTVRDIHISRCWGDGISAGGIMTKGQRSRPGRDYVFENVTCTRNRRQGLTIGSSRRVRIRGCEFSNTAGTPPAAGIDIEPDTDIARDILIEDCLVFGNRGPGIQLYKRAAEVRIRRCTIERNRGEGILAVTGVDCVFSDNIIRNNHRKGVLLRGGSRNIRLAGNRFEGNDQGRGGKQQVQVADDSVAVGIDADNVFE
ncbi:right-handed parallel beta-helix repeat-containing protein [Luteimonas sp. R10]|uniref:right-handed parallel beta-helix repeat-containing protein n=1 Tax=Luteimonas sp. R10 TaxID=3108176 RepID=UPI003089917D|nr:right-handed parallel beta-helix repeat-containing protein [Luteimonas sp. R10]